MGTAGLHPAGASQRRRHAWTLGISVVAERWVGALRLELTAHTDNTRAMGRFHPLPPAIIAPAIG